MPPISITGAWSMVFVAPCVGNKETVISPWLPALSFVSNKFIIGGASVEPWLSEAAIPIFRLILGAWSVVVSVGCAC